MRTATCQCGQLRATCEGEPVRISVCHCLECQKRSGSVLAVQARWPDEQVKISGESSQWQRTGDEGTTATFRFCPTCGSTVYYTNDSMPGLTAVAVGAFADPNFPPPRIAVYEERKHGWVDIAGEAVERMD